MIDNYDAILRAVPSRVMEPDIVLRFGLTPISKPLITYLGRVAGARQIVIDLGFTGNDPQRVAEEFVRADPVCFARDLTRAVDSRSSDRTWSEIWLRSSSIVRKASGPYLEHGDHITEPGVFAALADCLPPDSLLFTGNSMPIRDLDGFFGQRGSPCRVMGNRGVNGIDGLISTALGAASALERRVFLVLGDLSFFHDMNGLLACGLHNIDATIILINNNGGGIFHFLPQRDLVRDFEPLFATPTGLDYRAATATYGGRHVHAGAWPVLRAALVESLGHAGLTVIEVPSDREENRRQHYAIWEATSKALSAASGPSDIAS